MTLNELLLEARERTNKKIEESDREYSRPEAFRAMKSTLNELLSKGKLNLSVGYDRDNSVYIPFDIIINGRRERIMNVGVHCKKGKHTREKRYRYSENKTGEMVTMDTFYIQDWKVWSVDPDKEISEIVEAIIRERNEELSRQAKERDAVLDANKEYIDEIVSLLNKLETFTFHEEQIIAKAINQRIEGHIRV